MLINQITKELYSIGWSQDQHVYHPALGVDRPLNALREAFPDDEVTGALACLFYGGDFWDHEVPYTHAELYKVHDYIGWRLKSAAKWGYSVRVLEGTPSHDRKQCRIWESINNALQQPADFKYIDTLCIESHPILGDILYIPDAWKPTTDEVWEDVIAALTAKNLTMVDWIIMHGAFKHQLPEHLHGRIQLHDSKRFAKITRKYVLVGHVHLYSQYLNIISAGSIERLCHGEEAPKGTLRIHVREEGDEIIFQENKNARISNTLDLRNMSAEEVIARIEEELDKYRPFQPYDVGLRILATMDDHAFLMRPFLEKNYADVDWAFKDADAKTKKLHLVRVDQIEKHMVTHDLSPDAVKGLLTKRIGDVMTDGINTKINALFKDYKYQDVTELTVNEKPTGQQLDE